MFWVLAQALGAGTALGLVPEALPAYKLGQQSDVVRLGIRETISCEHLDDFSLCISSDVCWETRLGLARFDE